MSYYPGTDIRIRDIAKVLLDLSNYTTQKELKDAKSSTPNLACEKVFIALKVEVDKLDIYKLVNVLMV